MAVTQDTMIYPLLTELAACLCTEVRNSGLPELCFCGLLPGAQAAYDFVGFGCADDVAGMGWVRLVTTYPSNSFPVPMNSMTRCDTGMAFVAEVGILRPAMMEADQEPADAAGQLAMVEQQMAEMQAMRRAILCCFDAEVVLGQYTPIGPAGLVIGGTWGVTVAVE